MGSGVSIIIEFVTTTGDSQSPWSISLWSIVNYVSGICHLLASWDLPSANGRNDVHAFRVRIALVEGVGGAPTDVSGEIIFSSPASSPFTGVVNAPLSRSILYCV